MFYFRSYLPRPFNAWRQNKGYAYLNKPAAESSAGLIKYVLTFSWTPDMKGLMFWKTFWNK